VAPRDAGDLVTNIFDTCIPRSEVLSGELRDEQFAARLKDVVDEHAEPVYGIPERFFENTYVTEGLRTLVREVGYARSSFRGSAAAGHRSVAALVEAPTHALTR
jgi:hypothetical protein